VDLSEQAVFMLSLPLVLPLVLLLVLPQPPPCIVAAAALCFVAAAAEVAAASVLFLSHLAHLVLQAQPLVKRLAPDDHLHRDAGLAHVLSTNNVGILRTPSHTAHATAVWFVRRNIMALSD
jgi:hypothetical protein